MGSKTKVSKQVKVTQGDATTTFELVRRGMVIRHTTPKLTAPDGGHGYIEFTLGKPVLDALRELLGLQQPLLNKPAENTPVVPLEEVAKRFTREGDDAPDRPPEGEPVEDSGLTRSADKTESGMD